MLHFSFHDENFPIFLFFLSLLNFILFYCGEVLRTEGSTNGQEMNGIEMRDVKSQRINKKKAKRENKDIVSDT